jgi:hypothetical protein
VGKRESEFAAYLARTRWKDATPEERAENSRRLTEARWKNTTPQERSAAASKAAKARWAGKKKAAPKRAAKGK